MKTFQQFTEHHQKDKEGKVIEHGDSTPCSVEEGKGVGTVVKQIARIAAKKLQSKKVKKAIYKKGKEIAKQVGQAGLEGATDAAIDRARETGENIVRDAGKKKKEKEELAAAVEEGKGYQPEIEVIDTKKRKKDAEKRRKEAADSLPPHLKLDVMKKAFATEEDKAFKYVLDKIRKEVGKDGYVSKNNPMKPATPQQKAKVRAHKAKLAKQDHRDPTEKASDGRYSDRYSNRGSD